MLQFFPHSQRICQALLQHLRATVQLKTKGRRGSLQALRAGTALGLRGTRPEVPHEGGSPQPSDTAHRPHPALHTGGGRPASWTAGAAGGATHATGPEALGTGVRSAVSFLWQRQGEAGQPDFWDWKGLEEGSRASGNLS